MLPENLFYNTTAPGVIIVINKSKRDERKGQILLMNASKLFKKVDPKLPPDENIEQIADIYLNWIEEEGISKIITREEAARNDYNLSPSRYVAQNGEDDTSTFRRCCCPVKRGRRRKSKADAQLKEILKGLGVEL